MDEQRERDKEEEEEPRKFQGISDLGVGEAYPPIMEGKI